MSSEKSKELAESYDSGLNFAETELSLSLPGEQRLANSGRKRGFQERIDLTLGSSSSSDCISKSCDDDTSTDEFSSKAKLPAKARVVGWPPVKSSRKSLMKSSKFIKVAVDGAPYLRKVDLETYSSYQQLLTALEDMFSCLSISFNVFCRTFTSGKIVNEKKLMDPANGIEWVPTYEDKDGDWMLVGDVPWKMFVESSKRIRLMKSSEAIGLGSRISTNCSSFTGC